MVLVEISSARALPAPSLGALLDHFSLTPLLPVAVVAAGGWYTWRVRSLRRLGETWPVRRSVTFGTGLLVVLWVGWGGLEAFAASLFWVWTTQLLVLLLVVPVLLVAGQPVELARRSRARRAMKLLESRPVRAVANPLVAPAVLPILSVVLFFGPVPGWSIADPFVGWIVQLAALGIGCAIVLPLLDVQDVRTSLAIGVSLAIGFLELLIDAVPGIVLRLQTHLSSTFAQYRVHQVWTGSALHDQQNAGTILWSVAELIDIPFLIVLFVRWSRVDSLEAAALDTASSASGTPEDVRNTPDAPVAEPWWLSDPQLRERYHGD